MSYFRHSLRNLATKVAVALIAFAIGIWIPAVIGPELFGKYSFLSAGLSVLITLSSMGFGAGIVFLLSTSKYGSEATIATNVWFGIAMGLVNALLIFFAFYVPWFRPVLAGTTQMEIIMLMGASLFQSISFVTGRVILGVSHFASLNFIELTSALINPFSLLALYYVTGKDHASFIYMALFFYSFFVFLLHGFWILTQKCILKWNTAYFLEAMNYGKKSWAGDMALRANLRLDQLILGAMTSAGALGVYSVSVKLAELLWFLPDAAGPVLFNAIASKREANEQVFILSRTHRILFFLTVVSSFIWVLLTWFFILPYVLKGPYDEVLPLFILLLPGTLALVSSKLVTKLFSSTGQVMYTTRITLIGSAVSVLFYIILIPEFGHYGAACASTLGYGVLALCGWMYLMQKYKCTLKELFVPTAEDFSWILSKCTFLWKRG